MAAEVAYEAVNLNKKKLVEEVLVEERDDAIIRVAKMRKRLPPKLCSKARNIASNIINHYCRVSVKVDPSTDLQNHIQQCIEDDFTDFINTESSHNINMLSKIEGFLASAVEQPEPDNTTPDMPKRTVASSSGTTVFKIPDQPDGFASRRTQASSVPASTPGSKFMPRTNVFNWIHCLEDPEHSPIVRGKDLVNHPSSETRESITKHQEWSQEISLSPIYLPWTRGAKKRLERGLSPRPKRSCVGDESCLALLEQKRQKLLEKDNRDKERLKRAADLRKRRIENQERVREKKRKAAEVREMRKRNAEEYINRIKKQCEDKAKLMEERIKEAREMKKQRLRKPMAADTRRKCEEEERLKKFLEQEEREWLRCRQERLQQQKQEEVHQNVIRQMINKHNTSLSKPPMAGLNSSTTANTSSSKINSYEITPVKEKFVTNNKNTDNYDIDDKGSDECTDDEEAPKKRIPEWATGISLNTAVIRQDMNPPDIEAIFRTRCIEPPNLLLIFSGKKRPK